MLSILKNKKILLQILNQFDVDYDLFRSELALLRNDVRRIH
jgi:ATP-dependent Clp protease ATP-binding subunit ClpC